MHRVFTFSFFFFLSYLIFSIIWCYHNVYEPHLRTYPRLRVSYLTPHSTSSWLIWYFTWTLPPWLHVCSVLNLVCHRYWWRHDDVMEKDTLDIPWCILASVPIPISCTDSPFTAPPTLFTPSPPPQNNWPPTNLSLRPPVSFYTSRDIVIWFCI